MTKDKAPGMHHEEIKAAIRRTGISAEGLSEHWGFDKTAIAVALKRPWPAVQELIASYLNLHPQAIWPDRYDSKGRPIANKQSVNKSNVYQDARNSDLAKVA